jgi:uncharacterized membrane protein
MTAFALTHLIAGTLACLSGLVAFIARKGGKVHRLVGRVFVVSMVITAGGGAVYAFNQPEALTGLAGLFTCYLVLSSIHTVRKRGARAVMFDGLSALTASLLAIAFFVFGALAPPLDPELGVTPVAYYVFGGIALLAGAGDTVTYFKRGLTGRWRIARHLWRMGFAFHIALGSILEGPRTSVFPEPLRDSPWLSLPVDASALAVVLWLGLVLFGWRFRKRGKRTVAATVAS